MGFEKLYQREGGKERKGNDYYPTHPWVTYSLMTADAENIPERIWEPAAGRGWMAKEISMHHKKVLATDLHSYENSLYPTIWGNDFLKMPMQSGCKGIITNPPYNNDQAEKFIRHGIKIGGEYVAMLCRLAFMESQKRYSFFTENPPSRVFVLSTRMNSDEEKMIDKPQSGMVPYAWFVWDMRAPFETYLKWIDGKEMLEQWKRRESSSAAAETSKTKSSSSASSTEP